MEFNKYKMNKHCSAIVFSDRALREIQNETYKRIKTETGGMLLGHIVDDVWYVLATTEPGHNSILQAAYFEPDYEYTVKVSNRISKEFVHHLDLLGLWHRHPGSMDYFSGTDDITNLKYAKTNPKGAISGLVNLDPDFRLTMYHVSVPLNYEKAELFDGDDLIPDDLLKLKQPKNFGEIEQPIEESRQPVFSNPPIQVNPPILPEQHEESKSTYLDIIETFVKKTRKDLGFINLYFFSFFIVNLFLLVFFLSKCNKGTNDKLVSYQTFGIGISNHEYTMLKNKDLKDSLTVVFSNKYKKQKKESLQVLLLNEIDSLQKIDKEKYIIKQLETIAAGDSINKDSLTKVFSYTFDSIPNKTEIFDSVFIANKTSNFHKVKKKSFIEDNIEAYSNNAIQDRTNSITSFLYKAQNTILFILIINLIFFTFLVLSNYRNKKGYLILFSSLFIGVIFMFLPPIRLLGIILIPEYILAISFIGITALIWIFLYSFLSKKKKTWYEKNSSQLNTEKSLVNSNYKNFKLDNSEEDGRLFWHGEILSRSGNSYHIQIVYDNNFNENPENIYTYFIDPDLLELQPKENMQLPFVKKDNSGLLQLQFNTKNIKNSALYIIRQTEKWVNSFESWMKKEISLEDFKNLK